MSTLILAMSLFGCNSFTTVEEACLEEASPGAGVIVDPDDLAAFERSNCYRRLAKRPKARADAFPQQAVEAHGAWLTENNPVNNWRYEVGNSVGFTGSTATLRLEETGYDWPQNTGLIELLLVTEGSAGIPGDELLDFWFADPFARGNFLQSTVVGVGVSGGDFGYVDVLGADRQVGFQYWNILYETPATAYAETPIIYPRDGQLDVPPQYVHLNTNPILQNGQTYGYPITVTVGARESAVQIVQASITKIGDSGTLPFTSFDGATAAQFSSGLVNTLVLVPDAPFEIGADYQVDVKLSTDLGERRVKTRFSTVPDGRPIPAGLLRLRPDGSPAVQMSIGITPPQVLAEGLRTER